MSSCTTCSAYANVSYNATNVFAMSLLLIVYTRYTLNPHFFAAQSDTLWLVRLDALLADVDLLPQHQTFLHHQYFFHNGDNRRAILLPHWHGTIYHTLHRHARDCDLVVQQWFIDESLVFVYHLGN